MESILCQVFLTVAHLAVKGDACGMLVGVLVGVALLERKFSEVQNNPRCPSFLIERKLGNWSFVSEAAIAGVSKSAQKWCFVEDFERKRLTCCFTCFLITMRVKSFTIIEFGTFWCLIFFNLKDKKRQKRRQQLQLQLQLPQPQQPQSQQINIPFHIKAAFSLGFDSVRPQDATIYELHVRDFSAMDSTVKAAWKGKYLAFEQAPVGVEPVAVRLFLSVQFPYHPWNE